MIAKIKDAMTGNNTTGKAAGAGSAAFLTLVIGAEYTQQFQPLTDWLADQELTLSATIGIAVLIVTIINRRRIKALEQARENDITYVTMLARLEELETRIARLDKPHALSHNQNHP